MHSIRLIAVIEVFLYLFFSFLCSLIISYIFLPYFNELTISGLSMKYYIHPGIMVIIGSAMILISIAVILRLSRYLYQIKPVCLLTNNSQSKIWFSRWMLVLQFVISIILITCSIVMIRQTNYIRNKPLGFNRNILEVRSPSSAMNKNLNILKEEIKNIPGIKGVTVCNGNPVSDN